MRPDDYGNDSIRDLERSSIRDFIGRAIADGFVRGRVLDFGCGEQPYRSMIEAAGDVEYHGYDPRLVGSDPAVMLAPFDTIVCTQVMQYVDNPEWQLVKFRDWLVFPGGGHLIMTYPTNWDEVEPSDLWRFTKAGMERLLAVLDFDVLKHERRAAVELGGFKFPLGYGVIARAK